MYCLINSNDGSVEEAGQSFPKLSDSQGKTSKAHGPVCFCLEPSSIGSTVAGRQHRGRPVACAAISTTEKAALGLGLAVLENHDRERRSAVGPRHGARLRQARIAPTRGRPFRSDQLTLPEHGGYWVRTNWPALSLTPDCWQT